MCFLAPSFLELELPFVVARLVMNAPVLHWILTETAGADLVLVLRAPGRLLHPTAQAHREGHLGLECLGEDPGEESWSLKSGRVCALAATENY
jgi:hypothetical protein